MKKTLLLLAFLVTGTFALQSCEDDIDDVDVPVYDFVWKGMNLYYLWKDNVPDLNDKRFESQRDLNDYLRGFATPENLFESLLYRRNAAGEREDRFSVIFKDYNALENALQGVVKSNGLDIQLVYKDEAQTEIFGYVRYVLPDSDASGKDIQRGDVFYAVNGTTLTPDNYQSLLGADAYTLNMADYNEGAITPNGQEVQLTKSEFSENPVYKVNVVTAGSSNVGYLMYNGFYSSYDRQLNDAIGQLAAQNINELVLDLRYNSGGSVRTATYLASMITGQFNGQLFAKEQWNSKLQANFEANNPDAINNYFSDKLSDGTAINHLNLNRVYIIATDATASASELVINCLKPYINVTVVGTQTVGKNVGSVTLYDSKDFGREGRSNKHTYAMQPIVLKIVNKDGFGEYSQGIEPTIRRRENLSDFGVLGDVTEPLFGRALYAIAGYGRPTPDNANVHPSFRDSKNMRRFGTEMYRDNLPEGAFGLAKELK